MMREFDDNIPARDFDNFQFVNFTEIMAKNVAPIRKETEFALSALMEIPTQYKATIELNILGSHKGVSTHRVALPPPIHGPIYSKPSPSSSFQTGSQSYYGQSTPTRATPYDQTNSHKASEPAPSSTYDNQELRHGCVLLFRW